MTREEVIEHFSKCRERAQDCVDDFEKAFPEHKSAWRRDVEAYDMAIAALREQPRWISVKERLPEIPGEYLTYSGQHIKTINKTWWHNDYPGFDPVMQGHALWYRYDSEWGNYEVVDVTHWMPLPDKPEVEV